MSNFQKVDGGAFGVTAGLPASHDAAGFQALTFVDFNSCEIVDFSGWSDTWDTEDDDTWCKDATGSQKSKRRLGEVTLTLKYDKSSTAPYAIVDAAEASQADVISCQVAHENGTDFAWFTAQVKEANPKYGQSSSSITVELVLLPQSKRVKLEV